MSDWDFLHDMHEKGYSPDQIMDAAACGYNPYDYSSCKFDIDELGYSSNDWKTIDDESILKPSAVDPELITIFNNLVANAASFFQLTNRYLQIWGELGELYAEIEYGIKRHKKHAQGSDGKIGNDFIEVKTISPEKSSNEVRVKRNGHFNKLLIIKISKDFTFEGQLIARKKIPKGEGKHAKVPWSRRTH